MTKIRFTKMHGAGNDYIYVNTMQYPIADPVKAAIQWSDRHKGIGSDGLVLIGASPIPEADFSMRIFNADGSEAMMCGNASRCIGKYVYERGLTNKSVIKLLTLSGIKTLKLHITPSRPVESDNDCQRQVDRVTVDMGEPVLEDEKLFIPHLAKEVSTTLFHREKNASCLFVSMGNPHYVIFTDDINQADELGPVLEHHPAFPQRSNIEFVTQLLPCSSNMPNGSVYNVAFSKENRREPAFRVRVWERGSGITMACGTGACATAVAASLTGRSDRRCEIVMDGGTLDIEWCESDNHVLMTGPAEFVFDGEFELIN